VLGTGMPGRVPVVEERAGLVTSRWLDRNFARGTDGFQRQRPRYADHSRFYSRKSVPARGKISTQGVGTTVGSMRRPERRFQLATLLSLPRVTTTDNISAS
jgi:hypothetical protein